MKFGWCFWDSCGFNGHEWELDFEDENITHWMPMTEPPGKL